jgi:hypothetical protein
LDSGGLVGSDFPDGLSMCGGYDLLACPIQVASDRRFQNRS